MLSQIKLRRKSLHKLDKDVRSSLDRLTLALDPAPLLARDLCYTSTTSLRKQNSKFRVSDPSYGAVHKDVHCSPCDRDVALDGHPAPETQELTRHVPTLN